MKWPSRKWMRKRDSGDKYTDIEALFKNYDNPSYGYIFFIIISIFIGFLSIILYTLSQYKLEISGAFPFFSWHPVSVTSWSNMTATATSLFSSIGASALAVYFVNRANVGRLNTVRSLAHDGLLKEIFSTLKKLDKRYSRNKVIELKFKKWIPDSVRPSAVHCTISISQRTRLGPKFKLGFKTIDRVDDEKDIIEQVLVNDSPLDDLISLDFTTLAKKFPDQMNEYSFGVSEIIIGNTAYRDETLEGKKTAINPNFHIWEIDTTSHDNQSHLTQVSYKYEIVYEVPGFAFFESSEPTHGFLCIIDRTDVEDVINCYAQETINPRVYTHDARKMPLRFSIETESWVLPRRSVLFAWYIKEA